MSDLLGNLVSKALNLAPIVEPRPVSRFEPWQPTGALASTRLDSAMEHEATSVVAPAPAHTEAPLTERRRDATDVARPPVERDPLEPIAPTRLPAMSERIERVIVERNLVERDEPNRSLRDSTMQPVVTPPAIARELPRAAEPPTLIERVERLIIAQHDEPRVERPIIDRHDEPRVETRFVHDERPQQPMTTLPAVGSDRTRPMPMIETVGRTRADRDDGDHALDRSIAVTQSLTNQPNIETLDGSRFIGGRSQTDRILDAQTAVVQPIIAPSGHDTAIDKPTHTDRVPETPTVIVQSIIAAPAPDTSINPPLLPPRPVPVVERMPTAVEHHLRSDNTPTPPPATPTIHVSIGRVEVRATLPPAPIKRSSSSASTTSLDDYLRRRAGDRR